MFDAIYNTNQYYQSTSSTPAVNAVLTAINVLITFFVNFIVFTRRRKNERQYQQRANLLSSLVVKNIDSIAKLPAELAEIVYDIVNAKIFTQLMIVSKIEKGCDSIELALSNFESSIISVILIYDKGMADEIKKHAEQCSDEITKLLTSLSIDMDLQRINNSIIATRTQYCSSVNGIILKYSPKP